MSLLTPVGIGLLSTFLALILKESGFKGARLFSLLAALAVIFSLSEGLTEAVRLLGESANMAGASDGARSVLKVIGISYIFGLAAESCRELGESGIASAVTLAGRVEIFLVGVPYLTELLSLGAGLLGEG